MKHLGIKKFASYIALAPLVAAASCSTEPKPRGQLMLAISADLSMPENMNEVAIEVLDERGNEQHLVFPIQPEPLGKPMPGTIAITPAGEGGQRVRVRVMGQKNDGGSVKVRVVREAVVTIPRQRVGMLTMPLRWLCDDQVEPSPDGSFKSRGCADGETCVAGVCKPAEYDGEQLSEYQPQLVYGGGEESGRGGTCVDVVPCFEKGVEVLPETTGCTIPTVKGGSGVNVALVPTAAGQGHCKSGGDCLVPIDRDDSDGWKESNGRIQLPPAVCQKMGSGSVKKVVVTSACETKTMGKPICGPWTNVQQSAPVGTQTPPIGGAGGTTGDGGIAGGGGTGGGSPCVGESIPLTRVPSAVYLLADASLAVTSYVPPIQTALDDWHATWDPSLHIGYSFIDASCGASTSPMAIVPGTTVPPLGTTYAGNGFSFSFPLDGAFVPAMQSILTWRSQYPDGLAKVVVLAAGEAPCGSTVSASTATSLFSMGVETHVISINGSTALGAVAVAGGTGSTQYAPDAPTMLARLTGIVQPLLGRCRYAAPTSQIALQDSAGTTTVLSRYSNLDQCSGGPGYHPDVTNPSLIELCSAECSRVTMEGWTAVETTATCGMGGTAGVGGTVGAGGTGAGGGAALDAGAPF